MGSLPSGSPSDTCFEPRSLKVLYALLIFVPIAIVARMLDAPPIAVFILSAIAIVPLSGVMGAATETVAEHTSPAIGGVLSATMGNLAELIIASVALQAGLIDLVKASITGSILGNLLLVLGIALFAGGLKFKVQKFNRNLAGHSTTVLLIAVFGLVVPALFHGLHPDPERVATVRMSHYVAFLLIAGYVAWLVFSLGTHSSSFGSDTRDQTVTVAPKWSSKKAMAVLVAAAIAIGVMAEVLVSATEQAVKVLGLSEFFVGLILIPIIGNAAENSSAIIMAVRNRMDLALNIAIGSSIQVALLIAPLLVLIGMVFHQPMDLAFTTMEVASIALAVGVASSVIRDAESNWLEGAFLLLAYAVLGVAFFFF
ncbi:MAG TPA: calcium/proton exchanger [Gemmatimonadaceae bacterium]|nr:calcium/proton exchanger [Gemmatimonadaceae bacterium]